MITTVFIVAHKYALIIDMMGHGSQELLLI